MTELVDDLLDVSRVTRGLVELERQPVEMKAVLGHAIEQVRPLIEARGHQLTTRMVSGDATVLGDRTRLVQVVSNLLNNAAKYTPPNGALSVSLAAVTVSASGTAPAGAITGTLSVTLSGTGVSASGHVDQTLASHDITLAPPSGYQVHVVSDISEADDPRSIYFDQDPPVAVGAQILLPLTTDTYEWAISISSVGWWLR